MINDKSDSRNNPVAEGSETAGKNRADRRSGKIVPLVLIACMIVVAFWEVMSNRSRDLFQAFDLTAADFKGFSPAGPGWLVTGAQVASTPNEPNIISFRMTARGEGQGSAVPVLVRVVHGYNMHDCMRIKGYKVEIMEDRRPAAGAETGTLPSSVTGPAGRLQVWRLTSGAGDVSIWVTSVLRAGDFNPTDVDVRSLPFPRIGIPDDPNWIPRGLTLSSLRHPVQNFRLLLRAKWNNSRCDIATFLKLKTPAWVNNELLTLVACSDSEFVKKEEEKDVAGQVIAAHKLMQNCLRTWRSATIPVN